jgi:hypothetical protein
MSSETPAAPLSIPADLRKSLLVCISVYLTASLDRWRIR